jgi:hypothetical protein
MKPRQIYAGFQQIGNHQLVGPEQIDTGVAESANFLQKRCHEAKARLYFQARTGAVADREPPNSQLDATVVEAIEFAA